jgi:cytidine deaminase
MQPAKLTPSIERDLVHAASKARELASAAYSRFKVGAALLTPAGKIIVGSNVESASYGLTCCAERVALFSALSAGERQFSALAVVADVPGGPMPCGACRQLLAEYAPGLTILSMGVNPSQEPLHFTISELLPKPFLSLPSLGPLDPES